MEFPHTISADEVDSMSRPVFSFITEATFFGEAGPHQHDKAQLMYVDRGVLTVEADGGIWTVPPRCALWIPSGIPHAGRVAGQIKIASLYIDRSISASLPRECSILFVPPFLRELVFRFNSDSTLARVDQERERRLIAVLLDELSLASPEPIHLPMPSDRRLRRLCEAMINDPALRFTIEEWGSRVGASSRTLSRLFQRETGMSFLRWRQQLHVGLALQRLGSGDLVTNIAGDFGYENVSAFIAMFKRMLGTSPTRYFENDSHGPAERRDLSSLKDNSESEITRHANIIPLRRG